MAHLTRSNAGHVRGGMEFVDLSELEGRLVAMLFRRDEVWRLRWGPLPQIPDPDRACDLPVR